MPTINQEENADLYKTIFEMNKEAIGLSFQGIVLMVNQSYVDLFGYNSADELVGKSLLQTIAPEKHKEIESYIKKRAEGLPIPNIYSTKGIRKNGEIFDFEINVSQVHYNNQINTLVLIRDITEKLQSDRLLKESELRYRLIFENSGTINTVWDTHCRLIMFNNIFIENINKPKEDLLGKTVFEVFPKQPAHLYKERMDRVMASQVSEVYESEFKFDHGNLWFRTAYHPYYNENHKVIGIQTISNNITPLKKAEEDLKFNEHRFRSIFENSTIGMLMIDLDGKIMIANSEFCELIGYSDNELKAIEIYSIMLDGYGSENSELFKKLILGEVTRERFSRCLIHKSGRKIWADMGVYPLRDNEEKPLYFIFHVLDVSDIINAENALQEKTQELDRYFSISPDLLCISSINGYFHRVNHEWEKILGYKMEQLLGTNILDYIHPDDKDSIKNAIDQLGEQQHITNLVARLIATNQSVHWIEWKAVPFGDRIFALGRDITEWHLTQTELIEAKNQAEQADMLKTQFLYNMSHEIRTPMNAICGFSALLCEPGLEFEKQRKFSTIIQQRTNDLLMLIEDIIDISKIEVNQLEIRESEGSLPEMLKDLHQTWSNSISRNKGSNNIEWLMECNINEDEGKIKTDFYRLKQVLNNLLSNANKNTTNGSITLGCEIIDNQLIQFKISDSGIGIPKDKFDVIFDRFRQLETGYMNQNSTGTGLGLSIVMGILKLMEGTIYLNSEIGKGTDFFVNIPYKPVNKIVKRISQKNSMNINLTGKTILVVEDDHLNSDFLYEILFPHGPKIIKAFTGEECLTLLYENKIKMDILLMDIKLPDINGLELTRKIRSDFPNLPIIVQTAYATSADQILAFESGCNDFITKPIIAVKLLEKIIALL